MISAAYDVIDLIRVTRPLNLSTNRCPLCEKLIVFKKHYTYYAQEKRKHDDSRNSLKSVQREIEKDQEKNKKRSECQPKDKS